MNEKKDVRKRSPSSMTTCRLKEEFIKVEKKDEGWIEDTPNLGPEGVGLSRSKIVPDLREYKEEVSG